VANSRLLDAEQFKYLNALLGLTGKRSDQPLGIRELEELLLVTRDAEGTRLLTSPGNQAVAGAINTPADHATNAVTEFRVYEACSVSVNIASFAFISLFDGSNAYVVSTGTLGAGEHLACPRRLIVPPGFLLRGQGVAAGYIATLVGTFWIFQVGEYAQFP